MNDSKLKEVPNEQIRDYAWESLIEQLARPFSVSTDVIRKRLESEKITPQDL